MNTIHTFLRRIPSVHTLVSELQKNLNAPHHILVQYVQEYLEKLRTKILHHPEQIVEEELEYLNILQSIQLSFLQDKKVNICKAINATGVILHTGLGRAVLPSESIQILAENLSGYCVLEVDCDTGERSLRDQAVRNLLCSLTHAEDATVVNNNAGAILLVLMALASGKEVIVSRGQLVEIGGSFRVPDIMALSNAKLIEVGCTNSTRLSDYEKAITERTAGILHVHTSNYKIHGFSHQPSLDELAQMAHSKNILLIEDAGSGAIVDFSSWKLYGDPIIPYSLKKGADIVTFSGDKVLGSCQAGIILGNHILLEKVRKHPFARATRVDKLTLSILESTLRIYAQNRLDDIPTYKMLTRSAKDVRQSSEQFANMIKNILPAQKLLEIQVAPTFALAGSGSFPTIPIESYGVYLKTIIPSTMLARKLRMGVIPIFVRIENDYIVMDIRTVLNNEIETILSRLKEIFQP